MKVNNLENYSMLSSFCARFYNIGIRFYNKTEEEINQLFNNFSLLLDNSEKQEKLINNFNTWNDIIYDYYDNILKINILNENN